MLSRPLVGMDEELSEFERLCAAARADIVDRSSADSSSDEDGGSEEGACAGGSSDDEDGGGRIWHTTGISPFALAQDGSIDAGAVLIYCMQRPATCLGPTSLGVHGSLQASKLSAFSTFKPMPCLLLPASAVLACLCMDTQKHW